MRYLDAFVFALSSNMLVCIALYRLYALRYPVIVSTIGMQRVPQMVAIGWILAAVFVSPQLYVWRQVTINGITQCVTIWTQRYHQSNNQTTQDDEVGMKVYNGLHLMIIFWMPLAILVVCYVLILHDVYRTLNGSTSVECSESDQQRINKTKANTSMYHDLIIYDFVTFSCTNARSRSIASCQGSFIANHIISDNDLRDNMATV
jgi:hypothetical protein